MADSAAPEEKKPARRRTVGSSAIELAAQVNQVRDWLVEGWRPGEIRKRCSEQWGLQTRTAENRIMAARQQMLADLNTVDRHEAAAQMIESATDILKMARETRQLSNAIGALRLQAELLGLNQRSN